MVPLAARVVQSGDMHLTEECSGQAGGVGAGHQQAHQPRGGRDWHVSLSVSSPLSPSNALSTVQDTQ